MVQRWCLKKVENGNAFYQEQKLKLQRPELSNVLLEDALPIFLLQDAVPMQVRFHALKVFEELVPRSVAFRSLVAQQFSELVELMVGHRTSAPLPPPAADAGCLREFGLECIERWSEDDGAIHQQVLFRSKIRLQFHLLRC